MATNRKAATDYLLGFMKDITPGGRNEEIYRGILEPMNDGQFETFVKRLEEGGELTIFASNYKKSERLNYDHMLKMAKKYGLELMQQLVIYDEESKLEYTTPEKHLVGTAEIRKQRQMQTKKFGAGKDDTQIDDLTGQVFGDSRGTGISVPEIRVLENMGLIKMAMELYDVKGGDVGALGVYRNSLQETGVAMTSESLKRGTGVKSLQTAQELLYGRHIANNVGER